MQVAASGKFSSRALRKVALDSMGKAIALYKQSGEDPNEWEFSLPCFHCLSNVISILIFFFFRILEDDVWFQEQCDIAMEQLMAQNPDFRFHQGSLSVNSEDLYS